VIFKKNAFFLFTGEIESVRLFISKHGDGHERESYELLSDDGSHGEWNGSSG